MTEAIWIISKGLIFDDVNVTNSESYDFGTDEVTREMAHNELKKIEEERDLYATISNASADAEGVSVSVNNKFRPSQSILRNFDFSDEMVVSKTPWWKKEGRFNSFFKMSFCLTRFKYMVY